MVGLLGIMLIFMKVKNWEIQIYHSGPHEKRAVSFNENSDHHLENQKPRENENPVKK